MQRKNLLGDVMETDDQSLTMRHHDHGEEYHSKLGALTEAQELYIDRSDYVKYLGNRNIIKVLDVGLGLAYNALSTIERWNQENSPGPLFLTSLELNGALVDALVAKNAPWMSHWSSDWSEWASLLTTKSQNHRHAKIAHRNGAAHCEWNVHIGDATDAKCLISDEYVKGYNFIWQDPFSPQKNPELWSEEWFVKVREVSHQDVVLMTYSVARMVRDHLLAAGWLFEKIPAMGLKRHWLRAQLHR